MTKILSKLAMAAAAALASTTLVSASAMAADIVATAEARTAEVRYGDLDLTSKAGRAALERRVAAAANRVCTSADPRDLMARANAESCRTAALDKAEPQIEAAVNRARVRMAATVNSSVARP